LATALAKEYARRHDLRPTQSWYEWNLRRARARSLVVVSPPANNPPTLYLSVWRSLNDRPDSGAAARNTRGLVRSAPDIQNRPGAKHAGRHGRERSFRAREGRRAGMERGRRTHRIHVRRDVHALSAHARRDWRDSARACAAAVDASSRAHLLVLERYRGRSLSHDREDRGRGGRARRNGGRRGLRRCREGKGGIRAQQPVRPAAPLSSAP